MNISKPAQQRIASLLEQKSEFSGLRVFIQGGGCSGFQYGFELEKNVEEDDLTLNVDGICVYVDPLSMQYLDGAEIDFKSDLMGSRFSVVNPNATTTCGCGSSFSV